jgi:hypothetical protein
VKVVSKALPDRHTVAVYPHHVLGVDCQGGRRVLGCEESSAGVHITGGLQASSPGDHLGPKFLLRQGRPWSAHPCSRLAELGKTRLELE